MGNWDVYLCNVNDRLASIVLDLDYWKRAPLEGHPHLLCIFLYLLHPRDDGLSSPEEATKLRQIEDSIMEALQTRANGLFVGRITTSRQREFYFYAPSAHDFPESIHMAMRTFGEYKYDLADDSDPQWKHYFEVLYPSEDDLQRMSNRKVIKNLTDAGDDLSKPRAVDHWIYFKSSEGRSAFIKMIGSEGFQTISEQRHDGEYPFSLHIRRVDNVDQSSIDAVVLMLCAMAKKMDGDYDGWETSVER